MSKLPTSGYSGTPLPKKLGYKPLSKVLLIGAPAEYKTLLGDLPEGVSFAKKAGPDVDLVHLFTVKKAELQRELAALRKQLSADAAVWVSWPKKSAKVPTDITEDTIRAVALPMGYVDIKVCLVSEVWSVLKLVVRKELR